MSEPLPEKNYFTQVDWSVFTQEQQDVIKRLAKDGHYELIAAAIRVERPEQEHQIQKLLNIVRPVAAPFESEV